MLEKSSNSLLGFEVFLIRTKKIKEFMLNQENKPYVVSADSRGLFKSWASRRRIVLPKDEFFEGMQKDLEATLKQYFADVDIIPEEFLCQGLNALIENSSVPVVSLDRVYTNPKQSNLVGFLDATRTVDSNLDSTGLGSRALEISLNRQVAQLANSQNGKTIALADDVIFEGKTMLQLVQMLKSKNVVVDTVLAGIAVKDGKELLEQNGIRVNSLITYDQVIDEICERDFLVGSPYSGRSVVNGKGIVEGAPYLYPFGKPVEWASIPSEEALNFSLFALSQSLALWSRIEKLSNKEIPTNYIAKPVYGLPEGESMASAIMNVMNKLKRGEI